MDSIDRQTMVRRGRRFATAALAAALLCAHAPPIVTAQPVAPPESAADTKPYDEKIVRLAELLGALHFLRELCGGNDGMQWRDRMRELIDAEGTTASRRLKFTRAFNAGYRSYNRSYTACTPTARTTIDRFLAEGAELADGLVRSQP